MVKEQTNGRDISSEKNEKANEEERCSVCGGTTAETILFIYITKQQLEDDNKIEGGEKAHLLVI